jgi:FdhD protein
MKVRMTGKTVEVALTRFTGDKREATCGTVVRELPFTINLNGQELVTTLCSPADLEYLVAGILFSEGIIQRKDDIISIAIDGIVGLADVKTSPSATMNKPAFKPLVASGGGKGISSYTTRSIEKYKVHSDTRVKPTQVLSLINDFLQHSDVYRITHGVHSAALCHADKIIIFNDDIGRHNALDKVFGQCLLQDIATAGQIIITSGRISSEILLKVAKRNIPILISKAPPTNLGVKLADELGITLIVANRQDISIYSHDWRVTSDEEG